MMLGKVQIGIVTGDSGRRRQIDGDAPTLRHLRALMPLGQHKVTRPNPERRVKLNADLGQICFQLCIIHIRSNLFRQFFQKMGDVPQGEVSERRRFPLRFPDERLEMIAHVLFENGG